jgi:hypothetical protein
MTIVNNRHRSSFREGYLPSLSSAYPATAQRRSTIVRCGRFAALVAKGDGSHTGQPADGEGSTGSPRVEGGGAKFALRYLRRRTGAGICSSPSSVRGELLTASITEAFAFDAPGPT